MGTTPDLTDALWRKSSYSGSSGDCVECTTTGLATWLKSSHSGNTGGECLEVSPCAPSAVPVRDSKNPAGPVLTFSTSAWTTFVGSLR
ncbi:DUF397 domain-containing protein [Streptomyces sp. NPDC060194]|uniref:DUF397 domain-containing protein n=1 Tax=Streptomyces sp. NPDC060194 TaxID=3347069 RepID=UPI0036660E16